MLYDVNFLFEVSTGILLHQILQFLLKIGKVVDGLDDLALAGPESAPRKGESPCALVLDQRFVVPRLPALVARALRKVFANLTCRSRICR